MCGCVKGTAHAISYIHCNHVACNIAILNVIIIHTVRIKQLEFIMRKSVMVNV